MVKDASLWRSKPRFESGRGYNMINYQVPFYENTSDDTHCFQACLRMVLKSLFPQKYYDYEYLDKVSAKVIGKWTWSMAALIWLSKQGVEVKNIEIFDYEEFILKKEKYLFEFYGYEVAEAQIKNSDIAQEIEFSTKFINEINTEVRLPSITDIKNLLKNKYLVACNVNSHLLNGKSGYAGHLIVVRGYDKNGFFINDPGLLGLENRLVSFEIFEKAWAYPNEKAKNVMAFRKK